jgi:hypothetical protein
MRLCSDVCWIHLEDFLDDDDDDDNNNNNNSNNNNMCVCVCVWITLFKWKMIGYNWQYVFMDITVYVNTAKHHSANILMEQVRILYYRKQLNSFQFIYSCAWQK